MPGWPRYLLPSVPVRQTTVHGHRRGECVRDPSEDGFPASSPRPSERRCCQTLCVTPTTAQIPKAAMPWRNADESERTMVGDPQAARLPKFCRRREERTSKAEGMTVARRRMGAGFADDHGQAGCRGCERIPNEQLPADRTQGKGGDGRQDRACTDGWLREPCLVVGIDIGCPRGGPCDLIGEDARRFRKVHEGLGANLSECAPRCRLALVALPSARTRCVRTTVRSRRRP